MYKIESIGGLNCIYLPRTLISMLKKIEFEVLFATPATRAMPLQIELYQNQIVIAERLGSVFTRERARAGTAAALLNLRAGMGKTFVASGVISRLGVRTLYIVPKRPLAVQAARDLRACFGPGVVVGQFDGGANPTHDITIVVINSALTQDVNFFSQYSFVVIDEVHMYCTDRRCEIFRMASAPYMLGMSATTEDRADGFDIISHRELAFDGIIRAEDIPGFEYVETRFDARAEIVLYNGPPEYTKNLTHEATGHIFTHYMHNQFIADPYRLRLFVDKLIEFYDWRDGARMHNIYVFAEEVEILSKAIRETAAQLLARGRGDIGIASEELGLFTGGLRDADITKMIGAARVFFSTYSYASTGVSIPKMTVIMFLTPRKANMKQTLARKMRLGSDMEIPRVTFDIVDNRTALKYQLGARRLAYDFYAMKQTVTKVNYQDIKL